MPRTIEITDEEKEYLLDVLHTDEEVYGPFPEFPPDEEEQRIYRVVCSLLTKLKDP